MHVQGKWPTVLVAGACVAGICAVAFFGWRWLQPDAPSGTVTPEKNLEVFDTPVEREREANAALPFRIAGVDDSVLVLEAVDICTPITADAAWSFGGDFSSIGSVPLSTDTVFGSTSRTPDDVQSYRAAIIGPDSAEATAPLSDDPYYEPRDGSGTPESLVWYSATLNEQNEMGVNNWQLSLWQNREGRARVLGSAEELNGTDQTPALPGEIVPKMNAEYVYYASNVKQGDAWTPSVLAYAVDGSGDAKIVGSGSFPAAVDDGVICATDRVESESDVLGYASVVSLRDGESTDVLTVNAADSQWCISGVWAPRDLRVVAFSHAAENQGCYIGVWRGDFEQSLAWFHVLSPTVVGSIAQGAFVWGAGSQEKHAQMFAFSADEPQALLLLGEAPGYSRPAISADASAVLVPFYNGMEAVKFNVLPFA